MSDQNEQQTIPLNEQRRDDRDHHQEQRKNDKIKETIELLKKAQEKDIQSNAEITEDEVRNRLAQSRQIGFNITASLEIENARKRQLVETFLKNDLQLPLVNEFVGMDGAQQQLAVGANSAFERLASDVVVASDCVRGDDEIAQLKRQLAHSQADARKNLQSAKKTRALCDKMMEILAERDIRMCEPQNLASVV
jgi:hypothetical protein